MELKKYFKKPIFSGGRPSVQETQPSTYPEAPKGILKRCNACKQAIFTEDVRQNYDICPKCGNYFRMHADRRIDLLLEEGSFEEWDSDLLPENPMDFPGYPEKVSAVQKKTGLSEAIVTGRGKMNGMDVVLGVCDGRFLMASMGEVMGEKITRAFERATRLHLPVILFCCSGGARMQEGIFSLMQMEKTAAAIRRHQKAGELYVSVLTDPTTGGVTASFAMLGDIILAEPHALIGFAGPRVIAETIGQKLPEGFQRAEFLLEHGFVDALLRRETSKDQLAYLLRLHGYDRHQDRNPGECASLKRTGEPEQAGASERRGIPTPEFGKRNERSQKADAWECVQRARKKERPVAGDYLFVLFPDFVEFHGDRERGDDPAIIGGIASFHDLPVTVIAEAKGRDTKDNMKRNFGMPSPEGYRKALRLMKQAEKFHRPVICLVDTPGAFCGIAAEEGCQGEAIARNLCEMSDLKVPVLSVILSEGGSGGALALAAADEVWMMEHAVYSILSPEGFASILWKDGKRAPEAARAMKLTAPELQKAGVIEKIIPEPEDFTRETLPEVCGRLDDEIQKFLFLYGTMEDEERTEKRYQRFRKFE